MEFSNGTKSLIINNNKCIICDKHFNVEFSRNYFIKTFNPIINIPQVHNSLYTESLNAKIKFGKKPNILLICNSFLIQMYLVRQIVNMYNKNIVVILKNNYHKKSYINYLANQNRSVTILNKFGDNVYNSIVINDNNLTLLQENHYNMSITIIKNIYNLKYAKNMFNFIFVSGYNKKFCNILFDFVKTYTSITLSYLTYKMEKIKTKNNYLVIDIKNNKIYVYDKLKNDQL